MDRSLVGLRYRSPRPRAQDDQEYQCAQDCSLLWDVGCSMLEPAKTQARWDSQLCYQGRHLLMVQGHLPSTLGPLSLEVKSHHGSKAPLWHPRSEAVRKMKVNDRGQIL